MQAIIQAHAGWGASVWHASLGNMCWLPPMLKQVGLCTRIGVEQRHYWQTQRHGISIQADTLLPGYLANIYTMLHGSGDERCLALYNRTYRKLAGVQVSVDGTVVAVCTDSVL